MYGMYAYVHWGSFMVNVGHLKTLTLSQTRHLQQWGFVTAERHVLCGVSEGPSQCVSLLSLLSLSLSLFKRSVHVCTKHPEQPTCQMELSQSNFWFVETPKISNVLFLFVLHPPPLCPNTSGPSRPVCAEAEGDGAALGVAPPPQPRD